MDMGAQGGSRIEGAKGCTSSSSIGRRGREGHRPNCYWSSAGPTDDGQAGIALLDDGSAVVGIDDQSGRERAHLYFIPTRGAGLLLQDGKEIEKISLLIPFEGDQSASPKLEMTDKAGKTVFVIPVQK